MSANTLGILNETIADQAWGYAMTEGKLLGINTNNFTAGQLLFLGPTGSIIGQEPVPPKHAVRLGQALRIQSINGSMYVRIDNGYELDELHNVLIISGSDGDLLVASGSNDNGKKLYINSKQLTGSYAITGSLTVTADITSSLYGTASWSNNAVTASYITTAQTASYITTAQTASYVLNAVSASFSTTSSFITASNVIGTVTSASYALSASYAPVTIPAGPWGISNSSGSYTYYSSLSASIAAATSGQVVEMFADVTATSVAPLKPNVTIQGNGHTYTYSGNTGDVFLTPASAAGTYTYYFNNINIVRANTATSTGAIFVGDGTGFTTLLNFKFTATRVSYTTTTGTAPIHRTTGSFGIYGWTFDGIDVIGNTSGYLFDATFAVNNIKNSKLENTGTGGCITTPNVSGNTFHENNYIKTVSGNGIFCNYAGDTIKNCTVITNSGNAIAGQSGASAYNCFAFANTGRAYSGMNCYGCAGQTATGTVFYASNGFNCNGRSASGYAVVPFIGGNVFYNSSFHSISNIVCYDTTYVASFYNCSLRTDYNNVAGHAISVGTNLIGSFVNNYIQTANSAANCIKGTSSGISAKYAGNIFNGSLTPINANVTQTVTNTQDNQGNILI